MIHNLKNRPSVKEESERGNYAILLAFEKWVEGLEKELRELTHDDRLCADCRFSGKPCKPADPDCKALEKLKEVLGETHD